MTDAEIREAGADFLRGLRAVHCAGDLTAQHTTDEMRHIFGNEVLDRRSDAFCDGWNHAVLRIRSMTPSASGSA